MNAVEASFGVLMGLISISSTVVIIMLIVRAIQNRQASRERMFTAALEKGVYDPRIMNPRSASSGAASLGWGIFFAMVGIALLIGFGVLGIISEAALGGLIPLAIGIGLIAFHVIMKRGQKDIEHNGDPIQFEPKATPPTVATKEDHGNFGG